MREEVFQTTIGGYTERGTRKLSRDEIADHITTAVKSFKSLSVCRNASKIPTTPQETLFEVDEWRSVAFIQRLVRNQLQALYEVGCSGMRLTLAFEPPSRYRLVAWPETFSKLLKDHLTCELFLTP